MARAFWLLVLVGLVAVTVALPFGIRARFEGFSVPSASMEPTLLPGDYILVDKSVRSADRGQLIVFADGDEFLVKRVIGVGGEEVRVDDGKVYVGCEPSSGCAPLDEPWAWFGGAGRSPLSFGPVTVPADGYFVMADNRNAGEDSRQMGAIRWERIAGRPLLVYWSTDPDSGAIRWSRIGRWIR